MLLFGVDVVAFVVAVETSVVVSEVVGECACVHKFLL